MTGRIGLIDIFELAMTCVPQRCRKKIEEDLVYTYWPAHEIGHFLVANKAEVCREEYGIEARSDTTRGYTHAIAHELAAMHVSARLLKPISPRLVRVEVEHTDEWTLDLRDDPTVIPQVAKLLRFGNAERVPHTKADLRRLLRWKRRELGLPSVR